MEEPQELVPGPRWEVFLPDGTPCAFDSDEEFRNAFTGDLALEAAAAIETRRVIEADEEIPEPLEDSGTPVNVVMDRNSRQTLVGVNACANFNGSAPFSGKLVRSLMVWRTKCPHSTSASRGGVDTAGLIMVTSGTFDAALTPPWNQIAVSGASVLRDN
jgi:hypothetical protein